MPFSTLATISIKYGGRVLIVEDNRPRQDWFFDQLKHEVVTLATLPETALENLRMTPPELYDAIFLDYDLGPEPIKNSTITSKPVVDYLNEVCRERRQQRNIIIHTQNKPAGDWMIAILPGATRLPFGSFKIEENFASSNLNDKLKRKATTDSSACNPSNRRMNSDFVIAPAERATLACAKRREL